MRASGEESGWPPPTFPIEHLVRVYTSERESFRRPERVHAAHIERKIPGQPGASDAWAEMERAHDELRAGEPFDRVAEKYSDCKGNGGDLGYFPRGQMVEEFDAVVFSLEPGTFSPIFHTPFGLHIAFVHERSDSYLPEFEEARPEIENGLAAMAMQRSLVQAMERLRAASVIAGFQPYAAAREGATP